MDKLCTKCRKSVDEKEKVVACDSCRVVFHLNENCTGLSSSEIRAVVIQKRLLIYFCEDCRTSFKQIPLLVGKINSLQEEVNELRKEVSDLKEEITKLRNVKVQDSQITNYEAFMEEFQERKTRANNIMIYNVLESQSNNLQEKISEDKSIIENIIEPISNNTIIKKVVRVGKVGTKPRPMKVILDSPDTVLHILRNKNKIQHPHAKISSDLTVNQRNHIKEYVKNLKVEQRTANQI